MLNMILRTYASGWLSSRDQANQALASAVCSRSSAAAQSRVSRYAARSSRGDRVTTNSSYSAGSAPAPFRRRGRIAAAAEHTAARPAGKVARPDAHRCQEQSSPVAQSTVYLRGGPGRSPGGREPSSNLIAPVRSRRRPSEPDPQAQLRRTVGEPVVALASGSASAARISTVAASSPARAGASGRTGHARPGCGSVRTPVGPGRARPWPGHARPVRPARPPRPAQPVARPTARPPVEHPAARCGRRGRPPRVPPDPGIGHRARSAALCRVGRTSSQPSTARAYIASASSIVLVQQRQLVVVRSDVGRDLGVHIPAGGVREHEESRPGPPVDTPARPRRGT